MPPAPSLRPAICTPHRRIARPRHDPARGRSPAHVHRRPPRRGEHRRARRRARRRGRGPLRAHVRRRRALRGRRRGVAPPARQGDAPRARRAVGPAARRGAARRGGRRGARAAAPAGGRARPARGPLLERLQATTSALEPPPEAVDPDPARLTYLVNPRLQMSSGKTLAQIAHAAVMAADGGAVEAWVAAGCPAAVAAPPPPVFDALCESDALAARVVDGGLTEVAPGTVTVLALAPGRFAPAAPGKSQPSQ